MHRDDFRHLAKVMVDYPSATRAADGENIGVLSSAGNKHCRFRVCDVLFFAAKCAVANGHPSAIRCALRGPADRT